MTEEKLENLENLENIFEMVKQYGFASDCMYYICKNKQIVYNENDQSTLQLILMYFYDKGELQDAVYSWLDGWDDGWSSSREKLNVKILGSYVNRTYAPEEFRLKMKTVFENILPYFGESEIHSYYKNILMNDFFIVNY